ncbi:hypothetical protein L1887_57947 [Cichorium endivia]|nr:hypothetical protein L1887_57947 [Cichorium endivia]
MVRDPVPRLLAAEFAAEGDDEARTIGQLVAVGTVACAGSATDARKGDERLGRFLLDDGYDATVGTQSLPELLLAGIAAVEFDKDAGGGEDIHVLAEGGAAHDVDTRRADEEEERVKDASDAGLEALLDVVERVLALLVGVLAVREGDEGAAVLHSLFCADDFEAVADAFIRGQAGLDAVEHGALFERGEHVADVPEAETDGEDGVKVQIADLAERIVFGLGLGILCDLGSLGRGGGEGGRRSPPERLEAGMGRFDERVVWPCNRSGKLQGRSAGGCR